MNVIVGERVWRVPDDQFIAAWNRAATLDEAALAVRALADGPVPRWAVMARAAGLRKNGVALKPLVPAGRPEERVSSRKVSGRRVSGRKVVKS